MILHVYSLFDSKAEIFLPPVMWPQHAQMVRMMVDECRRADSMISRHPADYILYQVADFDDQTGRYTPLNQFQHLGVGTQFMPPRTDGETVQ